MYIVHKTFKRTLCNVPLEYIAQSAIMVDRKKEGGKHNGREKEKRQA